MARESGVSWSSWPLLGREAELARIREALAAGATGVVVSGDFGVGKTHLAKQAVEESQSSGACALWLRATRSAAEIPFGVLGPLFSEGLPGNEALSFHDLSGAMRAMAGGCRVVLGVDDAHLLDPASAAFVLQAAERGEASAVVTVRAGEPCPDAVTALWKDAGSIRIELGEMSDEQLVDLIEHVLGAPLEHDARRWVTERSAGNLLYAQQLVDGAIESKSLTLRQDTWHLVDAPDPSTSLRELVGSRMGMLDGRKREALELLAVGEPLTLEEATETIGRDLLAELEEARLIAVSTSRTGSPRVQLAHPLYAELLVAQTPLTRARSYRIRLAEMVASRPEPLPADAVRRAVWLREAGHEPSGDVLLEAARAANAAGIERGAEFAEAALRAGAGPEAAMLLARSHAVHGRPAEAERALAAVESTIEESALALEYLRERASFLHWGLGRTDEALALLERACAWRSAPGWVAQIGILALPFQAASGAPGANAAAIEAALEQDGLDTDARRWLLRALAADRFWQGRVREACGLLPAIPKLPLRGQLDFLELATRSVVLLAAGTDLTGLDREMRSTFLEAADAPDPAAAALAAITVASTRYLAGRFLDARRWLNEAAAQAEHQDPVEIRPLARALQAGVALARGEDLVPQQADNDVAEASPANVQHGSAAWLAKGSAWTLLREGRATQAGELLLRTAVELEAVPVQAAELRYEAMRAGRRAAELAPALAALAERCDAPLTEAYALHARARADADPQNMLAASRRFSDLGACLFAAEAAAHAAAAFAAEGRQDSARRAAARSRELLPESQGREPLLIEGVDRAATELTPREAEMVELAARGMTNSEIAESLVISTRTVETHIYRAMRKLGINDRRDFRIETGRTPVA
ncbi:MAG TPA: LuxR C-terminal-related transcriptional regulator [Solirubrobacteraceae bacterium]|nr:LuxR C-terminal-related transcriptional regulator [Solirubrobacteraceae bacterium]